MGLRTCWCWYAHVRVHLCVGYQASNPHAHSQRTAFLLSHLHPKSALFFFSSVCDVAWSGSCALYLPPSNSLHVYTAHDVSLFFSYLFCLATPQADVSWCLCLSLCVQRRGKACCGVQGENDRHCEKKRSHGCIVGMQCNTGGLGEGAGRRAHSVTVTDADKAQGRRFDLFVCFVSHLCTHAPPFHPFPPHDIMYLIVMTEGALHWCIYVYMHLHLCMCLRV